jgi:hypothetical protein
MGGKTPQVTATRSRTKATARRHLPLWGPAAVSGLCSRHPARRHHPNHDHDRDCYRSHAISFETTEQALHGRTHEE